MTSPTDLAECLRYNHCVFRREGIPGCKGCEPGKARCLVCEAADALDRLSALESGASGEVTDEEVNRLCQFWFAPVEPEEDRFKGHYAQGFIERMKDAVVAVLGPRLAKAEQRCKELEAMEKRAKDADAIDDAYERGRTCDKRACGDALSAVQDYILSGKEADR